MTGEQLQGLTAYLAAWEPLIADLEPSSWKDLYQRQARALRIAVGLPLLTPARPGDDQPRLEAELVLESGPSSLRLV